MHQRLGRREREHHAHGTWHMAHGAWGEWDVRLSMVGYGVGMVQAWMGGGARRVSRRAAAAATRRENRLSIQ
jgi:hypothetical protein